MRIILRKIIADLIAYGADISKSTLGDKDYTLINWYRKHHIKRKEYYLVVGRFVPENNYELMIKEFMKSKSKKELVIITNVKKNKFYKELKEKTKFHTDDRIKFVGTIYNSELLKRLEKMHMHIFMAMKLEELIHHYWKH